MSRWPNKVVIGLTGNIAVGKSVVRQMLQHLGAYPIDADGLAHQAMAPGAPAYAPVVEMFGRFILDDDGRINRSRLGHIVFSYPDALAKLEEIVHPFVIQAINTLIGRAPQRVVVIEAIKLLETDLADMVDVVWVVDASPEVQLRRLVEKRGLSPDDARRRITAQPPQSEKLKRATRVINNSGSVDETWRQVQAAWAELGQPLPSSSPRPAAPPPPAVPPQPQRPAPTVTPAPSQAQEAPAAAPRPPASPSDAPLSRLQIRRGMPANAEIIAEFISRISGRRVDRMNIMIAFGQKSYLIAQDARERVVAVMGWQVENLIMRADELYVDPSVPCEPVISALLRAIEDASKELQSEVGFIFLPDSASNDLLRPFLDSGYERTTLAEIRIPAWREAVHELAATSGHILAKKLRPDRVMKPI